MNTKIKEYEIIDLGFEDSDPSQGFIASFVPFFEHAIVGIGDNPYEAYENALDIMTSNGIDISSMPEPCNAWHTEDEACDSSYAYVGIRYNLV